MLDYKAIAILMPTVDPLLAFIRDKFHNLAYYCSLVGTLQNIIPVQMWFMLSIRYASIWLITFNLIGMQ